MKKKLFQYIFFECGIHRNANQKTQIQRIHVFMARLVHYFGEGEIFDKL